MIKSNKFYTKCFSFIFGFIAVFIIGCKGAAAPKWEPHDSYGRTLGEYHQISYSTPENPNAKYNARLPEESRAKYVGKEWTQDIREEVCSKSPDSGYYCMGNVGDLPPLHQRYYFDGFTQTCRCMLYNGCDGNSNNFRSLDHCLEWCSPNTTLYDRVTGQQYHQSSRPKAHCLYFY